MRRKLAERPPTGLNPDDDYETLEREQWEQEVAVWDREHSKRKCDADAGIEATDV